MLTVNVSRDALIVKGEPFAAEAVDAVASVMVSVAPVPDSVRVSPRLFILIVLPLPLAVRVPEFRINVALLAETVSLRLNQIVLPAATLTVAPLPDTVSLLPLIVRLFPDCTLTVSLLPVTEADVLAASVIAALLTFRASPVPDTVKVLEAL